MFSDLVKAMAEYCKGCKAVEQCRKECYQARVYRESVQDGLCLILPKKIQN